MLNVMFMVFYIISRNFWFFLNNGLFRWELLEVGRVESHGHHGQTLTEKDIIGTGFCLLVIYSLDACCVT